MKNITIGKTLMPALGFGTYKLYGKDAADAVDLALNSGYTHIDTAQVYENEDGVGEGIKNSGVAREKIFLTTKVWRNNFADGTVASSVDESLEKLKTEYVDLLLVHWPFPEKSIAYMVEEIMKVRAAGKARNIGVSNFTTAQLDEAMKVSNGSVICNQVEYHPYLSQKPILEAVRKYDIALTAYSPVARGDVFKDKKLQEIGLRYGKTAGQVTLRWQMQQDNVAAIPKSGTPANIKANIDIFDFELNREDMEAIHALARPDGRQISPDWGPKWDVAA
jgi:diketogulonate reductase-like aldo/keto reductase